MEFITTSEMACVAEHILRPVIEYCIYNVSAD